MNQELMRVANSAGLWIIAAMAYAIVLTQATLFTLKAFKTSNKIGMPREKVIGAFRTGMISSIGPALGVLLVVVGLIAKLGGPQTWQRLGIIGSASYELMAANFGAQAMGVELGGAGFNKVAFTAAVAAMNIGAIGWLVVTAFFTPKLETVRSKLGGGDPRMIALVGSGAMLGAFSYFVSGHLKTLKGPMVAAVAGGVAMVLILKLADQVKKPLLKEFALGLAMIVGLIFATVIFG